MSPKPRQIGIIAIAVLVTFCALWAGDVVYAKVTVSDPLERVFKDDPSVSDYQVLSRGTVMVVKVTLKDVPDLRAEILGLEDRASVILKGGEIDLILVDTRDETLSSSYYEMHFDIQEALATGEFSAMAGKAEKVAATYGLDRHRIFVDEKNVYVQLHLNGRYLYEVIPRTGSGVGGNGGGN